MTKKKDTNHQRMLAAARRALAMRHAVDPVPRINARLAGIDGARKRVRAVNAPTTEQEAKAPYVETDVNDYINGHRVKIGRTYKRQRVRAEFVTAVAQLSAPRARPKPAPIATPAVPGEPIVPLKEVNQVFRDERGFMRPLAEIADLIRAAGQRSA